jgi:hypothetical protein
MDRYGQGDRHMGKERCVMGNVSPAGNMQAGVCVGEKLHLKRFMIFSLDFFYHF